MKTHERKCWNCGNVSVHTDDVMPEVLCRKCGSQDTRRTQSPEGPSTIADLVMLVARLIHQVRKHEPDNDVAEKAMDYLRRKDLVGAVLREIENYE